ncbi:hypothetical protein G7Y89_g15708 [Cudoniella acicularis]|uniref:Uncharacterized protein n=1 Tax=Cudoniella acicularis TaxID=354080 RepID=A0A8H4QGP3_9HELO|nr:hypothetical protein G7Y89_g15708 [Cudoniella acicularis]
MADEQPENGGSGQQAQQSTHLDSIQEGESSTPASDQRLAEEPPLGPLHRSGATPVRPRRSNLSDDNAAPTTRPRGRAESSRARDLEQRQLSPRTQMFKNRSAENGGNKSRSPAPMAEQNEGQTNRPRASTNSAPRFSSPGMRPRVSTWATGASPNRGRGGTIKRRPTVLLAPENQDTQSNADFSLARPAPLETLAANQPYVDPGYSELNPAYDRPANTRPVWGLAKPLPRVLRPGMIPTRSELKLDIPAAQRAEEQANMDLEQGRIEPTLRLHRISTQLQNARQQRENRLLQTFSKTSGPAYSPISPIGQRTSNIGLTFSPVSPPIAEENDLGLSKPSEFPPLEEEPDAPARPDWYLDDASSAATEHEQDGDLDGEWIGEEFPLKVYDPAEDEIHNLHTHWSVIRLRFREPLAELLAVTVQLTLGFCADLTVATSNSKAGNEATTDWAWGLATMVGIYIAGGISGAHLNPAISIMLWIYRGFPIRKVPIYMFAQLLGAFLAGLIAFGLFQKDIIAYGGSDLANSGTLSAFITYPRNDWIDPSTAFFTEFTATSILAVAVLALGDDTNAPPGAGMNAFVLGLIITVLSMAFGYNTGAAMNPARDLGPRLAVLAVGYGSNVFKGRYWIYGPWSG